MALATADNVSRERQIAHFLTRSGWHDARREKIPGDASFRRYERLIRQGETAILMDAPPEHEDTGRFVHVLRHLESIGMPTPHLYAESAAEGLLVLQDLGSRSVSSELITAPQTEAAIYADAVDLLAELAGRGVTATYGFEPYDAALLTRELELFPEWFLPKILMPDRVEEAGVSFRRVWRSLLANADLTPRVFVHRDYHADNLFLIDGASGWRRIGLLDFQDAVLGSPAYDLVSLLADARRDVSPDVAESSVTRFAAATKFDEESLRAEYEFYSAQRNAKILGIFARLDRRDGKPRYLTMIPRVWAHFETALAHPGLVELRDWREQWIDGDALDRIHALTPRTE